MLGGSRCEANERVAKQKLNDSYDLFRSLDELKVMCGLALQNNRPIVNGERYLTDQETADILRVTRRTLNDYRADGIIPYVQIGGKVLYAESDIEALLQANYHPAFKRTA